MTGLFIAILIVPGNEFTVCDGSHGISENSQRANSAKDGERRETHFDIQVQISVVGRLVYKIEGR
jgi:hypothetical protein